jgi:hypothetical protein
MSRPLISSPEATVRIEVRCRASVLDIRDMVSSLASVFIGYDGHVEIEVLSVRQGARMTMSPKRDQAKDGQP